MKIALVILYANPSRGGAERYTVDLAQALAKRGHDVSVVASSQPSISYIYYDERYPYRLVLLKAGGLTRVGRYRRFLHNLDQHLDAEQYDIVHAMLPVNRCDVYHPHAGMAAEQMGKLNRMFNPRRVAMADVERRLLLGGERPITIALSEYVKRSILQHYSIDPAHLATLFNAVDLERFQPGPMHEREKVEALFIGHDFERKGLTEAIRAVDRVADDRLHLTVVGNDRRHAELAPGRVTRIPLSDNISAQYREADFFVLPTKHDPCSLVVLEALAMGLPVISTVFNGATEIMTDGVHGFVLKDPKDVKALTDAMRKMLYPQIRARMRQACLDLRPRLSYEHHIDELLRIYERAGSHSKSTL